MTAERRNPCTAGLRLLLKNRQLTLVVCAAGLQQASMAITETFALSTLRAIQWGHHMSEYTAASMIGFSVVAMTVSGPFGRYSDQIDRRVACSIAGAVSFLPSWILIPFLILDMPAVALWANTIAKVVGAFTVSCNVLLAMTNDVTSVEDRDLAVGVYFAVTNLMMLMLNGVPVLLIIVLQVIPSSAVTALAFQVVLSALYFVCIFAVKAPESNPKKTLPVLGRSNPAPSPMSSCTESSNPIVCDLETPSHQPSRTPARGSGATAAKEGSSFRSLTAEPADRSSLRSLIVEPVRLAFSHRRLSRLFLAAFLIAFSGQLVMDIGGQFFNDALNLLPYGSPVEFQMLSALTMIPGALLVIPGFMITGHLAKMGGTLKLLRRLIPFTALLTCTGAALILVPASARWYCVPIVVIAQNYGSLVNVPMLRMVGGVAPPGRVGEALAAVGVAVQTANLVGNGLIVVINPLILRSGWEDPLWIYYPCCGILALTALIPVLGTPRGGWGAASGRVEDVVFAHAVAHVAAKRWQRQVSSPRRHAESIPQEGDVSFPAGFDEAVVRRASGSEERFGRHPRASSADEGGSEGSGGSDDPPGSSSSEAEARGLGASARRPVLLGKEMAAAEEIGK